MRPHRTRSLRARRLSIAPDPAFQDASARVAPARVRLHPHGLDLSGGEGSDILPLYVGSMHYWRHHPSTWGRGLDAMREMGLLLVDTYVPWGVHEKEPGKFDFGTEEPRYDVARFLRMAHERGLRAVVRPGPHINAELTYFGLPERVVWNRACQARTPRDNPVMLPMVPVAFPVPSYASRVFHAEVERWFARV
ncbi:MAG TPA: beta-galactosidase, partial [Polyangiaceae bacterium]|nr:beta-galactosidase [Polyangiaceae bacterium]